MFPPFPIEEAEGLCRKVLAALNQNLLDVKLYKNRNLIEEDNDRFNQGFMVGLLLCKKEESSVALVTFSGTRYFLADEDVKSLGEDFIFVPPIVEPEKIDEALKKNDFEIHALTKKINEEKDAGKKTDLKKRRAFLTDESLRRVFDLYSFFCIDRRKKTLMEICRKVGLKNLPPAGTGDCCAPKLLNYAFVHSLFPVSMCELFYAPLCKEETSKVFSPCDSRCALLLPTMLGLEILYRDDSIIVVNKQSGLLSVPGRGPEKQDCISSRIRRLIPSCIEQPAVHRLDMETSGLMVFALTKEAHRALRIQFEEATVFKQYVALLDGALPAKGIKGEGQMELYFRLDVENRPHQIWDSVYGKKAVTCWKILNVEDWTCPDSSKRVVTRVLFTPLTGRTHQLRLASADSHGFASPILGDTLYGNCQPSPNSATRLLLHSCRLEFNHPVSGERMQFENSPPF